MFNACGNEPEVRMVNGLAHYVAGIEPASELSIAIKEERKHFAATFGLAYTAPEPLIYLAWFQAKEVMEETLVRWLQKLCSLQPVFDLTLGPYKGIPSHTIYNELGEANLLQHFSNQLQVINDLLQSGGCPPAVINTLPKLCLASQLPAAVYQEAMPHYSQKTFSAGFTASTISLFKRSHDEDNYSLCHKFALNAHLCSLL